LLHLQQGHSDGDFADTTFSSDVADLVCAADHLREHYRAPALLAEVRPEIEAAGEAEVTLAGRTFRIRRQFLDDIATQPQRERIAALRRPLLLLHSPQDEQVGVDNATAIFEAAHHPKSFVALDGADHLLSRAADAEYAADVIAAWAGRFLAAEPQRPTPRPTQWQAPRIPMPSS